MKTKPLHSILQMLIISISTMTAFAQVNIPLDNPNIYYDGILYPVISSNSVIFNRHTPEAYADPSSGIVYAPTTQTRATQSGVRVRFKTASPTIKLTFAAQTTPEGYFYNSSSTPPTDGFTVSINGSVTQTITNTLSFTVNNPTPSAVTEFEINLPILWSVTFKKLELENGFSLVDAGINTKPKYAAFGTSISMGTGQNNTTQTYAYQVAKAKNWNLHNFAVAGSSLGWQLAYDVKGTSFDVISIEQGFNNWASEYITATLAQELALYGKFIDSLRKFQPSAKIYCITPITTTYVNAKQRYNLDDFRSGVCDLVATRKTAGDNNIFCINGASISDGTMTVDGIHLNIPGAAKLATSLTSLMAGAIGNYKGYIPANDPLIQYSGRIDFTNPKKPSFAYPGVSIKANFQGTAISLILKDYGTGTATTTNYYNIIIDGGAPTVLKVNATDTLYPISTTLSNGNHQIEIFKRTETSVGKSEFRGFVLNNDKTLVEGNQKAALKIEFIGDSYTCGYGNEVSIPQSGNPNTGFHSVNENNYNAWGAIASRTLNAQYMCTAASGRGLYRNNTGSTTGLIPKFYDQTIADQSSPVWDHNNYTPNILVIHVGTNDFYPVSVGNAIDSAAFVNAYINFVTKLRGYYPSACIICTVPNGLSDYYPTGAKNLTRAKNFIQAIVTSLKNEGDNKVYNLLMSSQGAKGEPYGEDYHPSLQTHEQMADELVSFINTLTDCSSGATTEKTPTIVLNDLVKKEDESTFNLTATSNSSGNLSYSVLSGNASAQITANGKVTLLAPGIVYIKVNQAAAAGFAVGSTTAKLTILSNTGKDTVSFTSDLALGNNGSWSTQIDAMGSKVNSFTQAGPIDVSFYQTPKTGANWPWVVLIKNLTQNIADMTYIKVTYKSALPLQVTLPQAPLSATGESYTTTLEANATGNTILIPISDFKQPTWATTIVPLDLSKVSSLNFVPVIADPNTGGNAIVEIQSVVLYKSGILNEVSFDKNNSSITLANITENGVFVNLPHSGAYQFQYYTLEGRELKNISSNVPSTGNYFIEFDKSMIQQHFFLLRITDSIDQNTVFKIYK